METVGLWSPSVWRVWIEICNTKQNLNFFLKSPSVWRVWIEMLNLK